ncbi:MAG TPA: amino acid ABC transporter substrate-binding protein [Candidatus Scatomorpha merdigallinarum]|nr:amino acid ABC transporter substrate-binding protein [Candidatus Scatomorpha merdigallinarum]
MKKFLALLLALVMVFALAACGESTTEPSTAPTTEATTEPSAEASTEPSDNAEAADFTTVEEGKLIMSTNAAFPPYETTDDTGAVIGIDPEIAALIAEKLGLELVIDDVDFDSALLAVQQGKADMVMAGVTVNEDRLAVMDFTTSYATGVQVVIVPEDSDITDMDGLEGKLIGCQRGTTGYIYASDTPENGGYGEENVVAYDNGITAVEALKNGQVDAVIIDNGPAKEFVEANPGLKILETPWVEEEYAIGLSKADSADALNEAINNALQELIDDGTVQSILDKYITAE